jgi:hypothetical protein
MNTLVNAAAGWRIKPESRSERALSARNRQQSLGLEVRLLDPDDSRQTKVAGFRSQIFSMSKIILLS